MWSSRVAIIGGGIAGCSVARGLAKKGMKPVVFEMGRGLGGRTATRRSREDSMVAIDHGAPAFHATSAEFLNLIHRLRKSGHVEDWKGVRGEMRAGGEFKMSAGNMLSMYVGRGGMSSVCEGLIAELDVETRFQTMIKSFAYDEQEEKRGNWMLTDRKGESLGEFGWIVATSSSLLHNRWTKIYGGPPPLLHAAKEVGMKGIHTVTSLENNPVFVVMMGFDSSHSPALNALPADMIEVTHSDTLSKVVRQTRPGMVPSLVLHSTIPFAQKSVMTHGRGGTAELMGAKNKTTDENKVKSAILSAFEQEVCRPLGINFDLSETDKAVYGPALHRWGSAFPGSLTFSYPNPNLIPT
ncbi:hypothetical protein AAMO2058_000418200 [Amorphochlora amoebiformis]